MINFNKEYFNDNCYFNLKVNGDKVVVSYSVYSSTLNESKNKEEKRQFKTKSLDKVKNSIDKFIKSKKKVSKGEIDKQMDNIEIDEYVDSDGTMLTSKTPIYNMYLAPRKTMDQTIVSTRISNDPVTRGYRVYYGESEDEDDDVISEIDFSDAFGYKETENAKSYDEAEHILSDMGIEDDIEMNDRLETLGFDKKLDKSLKKQKQRGNCKNCFAKRRLTEKEYLEEIRKQKMMKMVEDILTKKGNDHEIMEKDNETSGLSKIISKNLESIKKLAKKEGISISKLINILKQGE